MKDSPKLALLSLMTKLNDGTHVQSPYASYLKVCHLKPQTHLYSCHLSSDGFDVSCVNLHFVIDKKAYVMTLL